MAYGTATKLFKAPIRVPSCPLSDIWNTHGFMREMKAPENNPYMTAKAMINAAPFVAAIAAAVTAAVESVLPST